MLAHHLYLDISQYLKCNMLKMKLLTPNPNLVWKGSGYFENLMKNQSVLIKIHKRQHFAYNLKQFMDPGLSIPVFVNVTLELSLKSRVSSPR